MRTDSWQIGPINSARLLSLFTVMLTALLLSYCRPADSGAKAVIEETVDPLATDFFFMRNSEILEDLLEQLAIHEIEFWINEDESIGFYVRDTDEVDRIANESISVWITSQ